MAVAPQIDFIFQWVISLKNDNSEWESNSCFLLIHTKFQGHCLRIFLMTTKSPKRHWANHSNVISYCPCASPVKKAAILSPNFRTFSACLGYWLIIFPVASGPISEAVISNLLGWHMFDKDSDLCFSCSKYQISNFIMSRVHDCTVDRVNLKQICNSLRNHILFYTNLRMISTFFQLKPCL